MTNPNIEYLEGLKIDRQFSLSDEIPIIDSLIALLKEMEAELEFPELDLVIAAAEKLYDKFDELEFDGNYLLELAFDLYKHNHPVRSLPYNGVFPAAVERPPKPFSFNGVIDEY